MYIVTAPPFATTPDHFGIWLEDATRNAEPFMFDNYRVDPLPAEGGNYHSGFEQGWHWTVIARCWIKREKPFFFDPNHPYEPHELYSFDVIPAAPTRINVRAYTEERGRSALDALMVRMRAELPAVQPAAPVMPAPEAKKAAFDEPNAPKHGGALRLEERGLTDQMKDTAIKYLHRVWDRKHRNPSKDKVAAVLGMGDYRTIERWITIWPEIEQQAKKEYEQGQKRK